MLEDRCGEPPPKDQPNHECCSMPPGHLDRGSPHYWPEAATVQKVGPGGGIRGAWWLVRLELLVDEDDETHSVHRPPAYGKYRASRLMGPLKDKQEMLRAKACEVDACYPGEVLAVWWLRTEHAAELPEGRLRRAFDLPSPPSNERQNALRCLGFRRALISGIGKELDHEEDTDVVAAFVRVSGAWVDVADHSEDDGFWDPDRGLPLYHSYPAHRVERLGWLETEDHSA